MGDAAGQHGSWRLDGKLGLVTGGTLGIGLACVEELCALGATVLVVARNRERVARTVDQLRAAGHEAHGLPGGPEPRLDGGREPLGRERGRDAEAQPGAPRVHDGDLDLLGPAWGDLHGRQSAHGCT